MKKGKPRKSLLSSRQRKASGGITSGKNLAILGVLGLLAGRGEKSYKKLSENNEPLKSKHAAMFAERNEFWERDMKLYGPPDTAGIYTDDMAFLRRFVIDRGHTMKEYRGNRKLKAEIDLQMVDDLASYKQQRAAFKDFQYPGLSREDAKIVYDKTLSDLMVDTTRIYKETPGWKRILQNIGLTKNERFLIENNIGDFKLRYPEGASEKAKRFIDSFNNKIAASEKFGKASIAYNEAAANNTRTDMLNVSTGSKNNWDILKNGRFKGDNTIGSIYTGNDQYGLLEDIPISYYDEAGQVAQMTLNDIIKELSDDDRQLLADQTEKLSNVHYSSWEKAFNDGIIEEIPPLLEKQILEEILNITTKRIDLEPPRGYAAKGFTWLGIGKENQYSYMPISSEEMYNYFANSYAFLNSLPSVSSEQARKVSEYANREVIIDQGTFIRDNKPIEDARVLKELVNTISKEGIDNFLTGINPDVSRQTNLAKLIEIVDATDPSPEYKSYKDAISNYLESLTDSTEEMNDFLDTLPPSDKGFITAEDLSLSLEKIDKDTETEVIVEPIVKELTDTERLTSIMKSMYGDQYKDLLDIPRGKKHIMESEFEKEVSNLIHNKSYKNIKSLQETTFPEAISYFREKFDVELSERQVQSLLAKRTERESLSPVSLMQESFWNAVDVDLNSIEDITKYFIKHPEEFRMLKEVDGDLVEYTKTKTDRDFIDKRKRERYWWEEPTWWKQVGEQISDDWSEAKKELPVFLKEFKEESKVFKKEIKKSWEEVTNYIEKLNIPETVTDISETVTDEIQDIYEDFYEGLESIYIEGIKYNDTIKDFNRWVDRKARRSKKEALKKMYEKGINNKIPNKDIMYLMNRIDVMSGVSMTKEKPYEIPVWYKRPEHAELVSRMKKDGFTFR